MWERSAPFRVHIGLIIWELPPSGFIGYLRICERPATFRVHRGLCGRDLPLSEFTEGYLKISGRDLPKGLFKDMWERFNHSRRVGWGEVVVSGSLNCFIYQLQEFILL